MTPEPSPQSDPTPPVAPMPTLDTLGCLVPYPKYTVMLAWPVSPQPESPPQLLLATRDSKRDVQEFLSVQAVAWTEIDPINMIQNSANEQLSPPPGSPGSPHESITNPCQNAEPAGLETEPCLQLNSLKNSIDATAMLELLIHSTRIASKERFRHRCQTFENQGFLRTPRADVVILETSPDSVPLSGDPRTLTSANRHTDIAVAAVSLGDPCGLSPCENTKSAVTNALRQLICSGATPTHIQFLPATHGSSMSDSSSSHQENAQGLTEASFHFKIQPITGFALHYPHDSLVAFGIVEESQHRTTPWFKDEGDAIVLIGHPVDSEDPIQGLGGSTWLRVIHQLRTGQRPRSNLLEAQCLHEAVRSLIYGGAVKSACGCDDGGLAVRVAECCMGPSGESNTPRLLGAELDLTVLIPGNHTPVTTTICKEAWLFGESQNRILITTDPLDVGKILAQAKILGVPAVVIGRVGGTQLRIKSSQSEDTWDLHRLHNLRREAATR
jgi:hypothetical protein